MGRGRTRSHLTSLFGYLVNMTHWAQRQKIMPTGCIEFDGINHRQGYQFIGCIRESDDKRIFMTAHRFAMRLKLDRDLDPKEQVIHTCSNVRCVNPDHLILGNTKTRSDVMIANGRQNNVRGPRDMKGPQKTRKYKYTIKQMLYIRNHSREEIQKYLKVSSQKAAMIKTAFTKGYRWLQYYEPGNKE